MNIKIKYLHEISEYRDFKNYAIDIEGNVWSFKGVYPRKLKTAYKNIVKGKKYGEYVCLTSNTGRKTSVTIQRLMCLAFLEKTNENKIIRHIDGNRKNNDIQNLEWVTKKKKINESQYTLNDDISEKAKKVYRAAIKKGLSLGTLDSFLDLIFNKALDDYSNQYGLRKLLM